MSDLKEQLKIVVERIDTLESDPSNLVKDAALADLRNLYDAVRAVSAKATVEPPIEEPVEERKEVITPEPTTEVCSEIPESTPEPVFEPKVIEDPVAKQPNIADGTFESNVDRDILAGNLNRPPLQDLSSGIPLNEKFGIIQNLFSGSASDFGDAVQKLNNSDSAEEMRHYLDLLKQRLSWNEESESYLSFTGYVERRMLAVVPSNTNSNQ